VERRVVSLSTLRLFALFVPASLLSALSALLLLLLFTVAELVHFRFPTSKAAEFQTKPRVHESTNHWGNYRDGDMQLINERR
jgi:hypothetical protein